MSGWGRGRLLLNGPVWDQSYLQGSKRMIITGNYCINCLSPQRGTGDKGAAIRTNLAAVGQAG